MAKKKAPGQRQKTPKEPLAEVKPPAPEAPKPPDRILVSSQILADALGYTTRRIQQLAAEGVIVKVSHDQYDLVASFKNIRELEEDNASDRETKVRYLTAKADAQELETARLKGELVRKADVERVFIAAMTVYGGALDAMAARCAAEFAGLSDPAMIRQRILTEERVARESAGKKLLELFPRRS